MSDKRNERIRALYPELNSVINPKGKPNETESGRPSSDLPGEHGVGVRGTDATKQDTRPERTLGGDYTTDDAVGWWRFHTGR